MLLLLLFVAFAWMRTAILAGGIAVIRSGFGYVEGVAEVYNCSLATGLQAGQRVEQKKGLGLNYFTTLSNLSTTSCLGSALVQGGETVSHEKEMKPNLSETNTV